MMEDETLLLEVTIRMRQDGSMAIIAMADAAVPHSAVPTMMHGALARAMIRIPDRCDEFKRMEFGTRENAH